jgi:hypothetical protein
MHDARCSKYRFSALRCCLIFEVPLDYNLIFYADLVLEAIWSWVHIYDCVDNR